MCHYTSCNYRYIDFFHLILSLMTFIESYHFNKPKQRILTVFIFSLLSLYYIALFFTEKKILGKKFRRIRKEKRNFIKLNFGWSMETMQWMFNVLQQEEQKVIRLFWEVRRLVVFRCMTMIGVNRNLRYTLILLKLYQLSNLK